MTQSWPDRERSPCQPDPPPPGSPPAIGPMAAEMDPRSGRWHDGPMLHPSKAAPVLLAILSAVIGTLVALAALGALGSVLPLVVAVWGWWLGGLAVEGIAG